MLKNYLKIALRNLSRHKGFAFINIAGLSLGITACMLIGLYVWDEKQYDRSVEDSELIYRVYTNNTRKGELSNMAGTPPMFATALTSENPEVESASRVMHLQTNNLLEAEGKQIYEKNGIATDPSFFQIFKLPFKSGSASTALNDKNSVVISEDLAQKYFGSAEPVGKKMLIDKDPFIVKGVLKDDNLDKFHLNLTFIVPYAVMELPAERMQRWTWMQFHTYIKLREKNKADIVEARFAEYVTKKVNPSIADGNITYFPRFQPLKDIHLYSADFKFDFAQRGNITYVKALTIIAIFIILIACFNFINLSTAKSLQRAKEVGVRKTVGATKKQLISQFITETILLGFVSVIIATGITIALLPLLNNFTDKNISHEVFLNPIMLASIIALAIFVGVLSGLYPSFLLSRFVPVKVLKGSIFRGDGTSRSQWLRKGLVIVQFSLSVLLIISALIVYKQVDYLHNKELGFNKEEIMFFPMRGENMNNNYESFKQQILQSPDVSTVSIGYGYPGDMFAGDDILLPKDGQNVSIPLTQILADHDYVKTLGLEIVAGRDFSREISSDTSEAFIINETAVKHLGFQTPEKAIGQPLLWDMWDPTPTDSIKKGKVIGVVKDFHYASLYDKLDAAVIQIYPPAYWKVAVKMKTANIDNAVAHVKNVWSRFSPDYPLQFNFLDQNFDHLYRAEEKLRTLLWVFTALAIFIGCLGLFGLAAYAAERRTKEIGIRKVLGASVQGIVVLLSRDFIKLVLIAALIAFPIAWWAMNDWLQDFAYRITIGWWIFMAAALVAMLIAFVTISFQAIKAAVANPVKSLRTE